MLDLALFAVGCRISRVLSHSLRICRASSGEGYFASIDNIHSLIPTVKRDSENEDHVMRKTFAAPLLVSDL